MKRFPLYSALLAVIPLSIAWMGTNPSSEEPGIETMVLTLLDYDASSCNTNCELSPCDGAGVHLNDVTPFGNDDGEVHSCAGGSGCRDHNCNPNYTMAPDDLRTLIETVPSIPAKTLIAIDQAETNLLVNRDRRAVQVIGCEGLVLASVELTQAQQRELEID